MGKWTGRVVALLLAATVVVAGGAEAAAAHTTTTTTPATAERSAALAAVTAAIDATLASASARVRLQVSDGTAFGKPGARLSGTGVYSFVDALGALEFQPEIVFAVAQLYLNQPAGRAPGGTQLPWSFIDFDSEELTELHYQGSLLQAQGVNPLLVVQLAKWGGVRARATSTTGGRHTYVVTVDLAQAARSVTGPAQNAFANTLRTEATHGATTSLTITVDRRGRISRARYTPKGADVGTVTLSLSHYGTPVDVHVPPKDQVADVLKVLSTTEGEAHEGGESGG